MLRAAIALVLGLGIVAWLGLSLGSPEPVAPTDALTLPQPPPNEPGVPTVSESTPFLEVALSAPVNEQPVVPQPTAQQAMRAAFSQVVESAPQALQQAPYDAEQMLEQFDKDGDEHLAFYELNAPMDVFDAMDTDEDGQISFNELQSWR